MAKYLVSLYSWENPQLYSSETELNKGDMVIVEGEFGNGLGVVQVASVKTEENPNKSILRKAAERDIETFKKNEDKKKEILETAKIEVKKLGLELKIIDACITLDGSNIVIIFTADGRVDFRDLVKNLSKILRRSIRMQQIGSRDEARKLGDCGICGRELCCLKFSGSLPSISTDMARIQQIAHRGSERISGLCGRLMCCLSYEAEQYKEMMQGMPELHSSIKTAEGSGEVIEINAIKQEIKVKSEDGKIIIVKKEDLK
jgi:cell fate regulator YaaT (PSP1 superfamily)